jgi:acetyl esterase/lipase
LLMYPMLDNLHDTTSGGIAEYPIWNRATSLNAWEMYLGKDADIDASPYASPSRAGDLSGLPSTYLCVGDTDLFRDENVAFMEKLIADGSPGEFDVYAGVYHAAENQYPDAKVSKRMYTDTLEELRKGLLIR